MKPRSTVTSTWASMYFSQFTPGSRLCVTELYKDDNGMFVDMTSKEALSYLPSEASVPVSLCSSDSDSAPNDLLPDHIASQEAATVERQFTPAEEKQFKRFQRSAKKNGLLVTKQSYELYFRDHLTE